MAKTLSTGGLKQGLPWTGPKDFTGDKSEKLKSAWHRLSKAKAEEYLPLVEQQVSEDKDKCVALKNRSGPGVNLRIAGLHDTVYSETPSVVNGWGKFYLPKVVKMCVFGVVDGSCSSCDQLVLMTCEDKRIFAYDGEDLHEVASDLDKLFVEGLEYPASKSYYNGEAFKDMTDDDWADVKKGAVGQMLDAKHQELVQANKAKFLACLK